MPAKRKWTKEQLAHLEELFHTDLTNKEVASLFKCDYNKSLKKFWVEWFGEDAVQARFRRMCALSKTGDKNPMYGKHGSKHHRHVKSYVNWQGYRYVDVPEWYTGSRRGGKYLEHIIVGCAKYGLTELPKGYVIHHIDENKINNHPDNLELMTISEHMEHHKNWHKVQGVTTIPEGSSS